MSKVPIGWEHRNNQVMPNPDGIVSKQGEWKRDMYARSGDDEKDKAHGLPIGWTNRQNTATIAELSLDKDATHVAVAEMHLQGKTHSELEAITKDVDIPTESYFHTTGNEVKKAQKTPSTTLSSDEVLPSLSNASEMLLKQLAAVVIGIDSKMQGIERKLDEMDKKQDFIISTVSKLKQSMEK